MWSSTEHPRSDRMNSQGYACRRASTLERYQATAAGEGKVDATCQRKERRGRERAANKISSVSRVFSESS
jgi:hypothetical protein